ncbi:S-adenosylmethionine:tRNA ribosyltransferase-isomerase [Halobacillus shinanisalinarum]|uniref:S-adenosylmethionine:tRNA ribosyltransferase-isomerase n=1 Tax=Halobacillus shinanisalinarum TaxID=2932258 RepID=A0ABY4H444_9BACI|nr:S-adenosylmethionine:tRNA ribosyltransferase-isomerase [Halobacillus shinanisalinarum]UOQ95231.1 S-adenosylmethionine:tRNA ribosyltransferase-isomerase [Halobacillus shinanisalinarum]
MNKTKVPFQIPAHLHAASPAELRQGERDNVKLMVLDPLTGQRRHTNFRDIINTFQAGDVLVLNQSRTIPSSLHATGARGDVEVRLARKIDKHRFEVLLVGNSYEEEENIYFQNGILATVEGKGSEHPLQVLNFKHGGISLMEFIYEHGSPIYYEYINDPWPLSKYQTVFSSIPGSIEMTSAGRAFTWRILSSLISKGVHICYVTLHTSLSYYGNNKWPTPSNHPELYSIPRETVTTVNVAKAEGRKVIAVGTTVVRALESAVSEGRLTPQKSVPTHLYINGNYSLEITDALLTGFHEPEASHLDLLKAFINEDILLKAYNEALKQEYLWHEFGDMNLIMTGVS